MVTRRTLIVGGLAAAAVPAGLLAGRAASSRTDIVVGYLRDQLPGLAVSSSDLEGYAETFLEPGPSSIKDGVYLEAILMVMANPMLARAAPGPVHIAHEKYTRSLLTRFLLSTDFFGAAGQRPERTGYVGYYDPYELGCSNPMARLS